MERGEQDRCTVCHATITSGSPTCATCGAAQGPSAGGDAGARAVAPEEPTRSMSSPTTGYAPPWTDIEPEPPTTQWSRPASASVAEPAGAPAAAQPRTEAAAAWSFVGATAEPFATPSFVADPSATATAHPADPAPPADPADTAVAADTGGASADTAVPASTAVPADPDGEADPVVMPSGLPVRRPIRDNEDALREAFAKSWEGADGEAPAPSWTGGRRAPIEDDDADDVPAAPIAPRVARLDSFMRATASARAGSAPPAEATELTTDDAAGRPTAPVAFQAAVVAEPEPESTPSAAPTPPRSRSATLPDATSRPGWPSRSRRTCASLSPSSCPPRARASRRQLIR